MLAVSPSTLIPAAEDFRARLQDDEVTDKGAVVTELARATYVGNKAPFEQLTASNAKAKRQISRRRFASRGSSR